MAEERNEKPREPRWYVAHTYSGYENKVKESIEMTVKNRGLEDLIMEVTIPMERVFVPDEPGKKSKKKKTEDEAVEVADGEKKISGKYVERKKFPGYVMIKMIHTDESWYIVRNTRGCTGFVGPGSDPVPLTDEEVVNMGVETVRREELKFKVGDYVEITSGPMEGFSGEIEKLDNVSGDLWVKCRQYGRETTVQVNYDQVEALD